MSEFKSRTATRRGWKLHKLVWRFSGGRLGARVVGMPVLELVTVGHRSGQQRSVLLTFVNESEDPAVIGTNAGLDIDPSWVKNLKANPTARIRIAGTWRDVSAVSLDGAAHNRVWAAATAANPGYRNYLASLSRPVPIFQLTDRTA